MGKSSSRPQSERECSGTGSRLQLPVHLTCSSRPALNESMEVSVLYSADTVLYDVLKEIEDQIASKADGRGHRLTIAGVSKRSFLRRSIALKELKENGTLRSLQNRSITNYSEKAIRSQGVHIEVEMDRMPLRTIQSPAAPKKLGSESGGAPKVDGAKEVGRRLLELSESADSAYSHFLGVMVDSERREQRLLSAVKGKASGRGYGGGLTWRMRSVLLDWFFDLQTDLKLHDETVFAAIHYLDLFLSRHSIGRRELQLLGVTATMIASKTYEIIPQPMSEWLYLSHDQYSRKQMVSLERQLLSSIEWAVFQVTPCCYVLPWLEIMGIGQHSPHRFVIDLAVRAATMNTAYLEHPVSTTTAAAIALSFVYLRSDDGPRGESEQSRRNRVGAAKNREGVPSQKGAESATTKTEQQQLAVLAAASRLDLRGKAVSAAMAAIDDRVCVLIKQGTEDPAVSALFKLFTDPAEIEKKYGPHGVDLLELNIPGRRRPLAL